MNRSSEWLFPWSTKPVPEPNSAGNGRTPASSWKFDGTDGWRAAGGSADGDLGRRVAGHVPRGDGHAAGEARRVGEELAHEPAGGAVEDCDVRAAARAGGRDDVIDAVAGDVAEGDAHAAAE